MYLFDTSAWIAFFSRKNSFDLDAVCRPDEIYCVLPVYQEVLQGIKEESHYRMVSRALQAASFVENPLSREVFDEAVSIYRISRKSGITIRSSVDCLIAACAILNNLTIVHRNRDYTKIAKFSALKIKEI